MERLILALVLLSASANAQSQVDFSTLCKGAWGLQVLANQKNQISCSNDLRFTLMQSSDKRVFCRILSNGSANKMTSKQLQITCERSACPEIIPGFENGYRKPDFSSYPNDYFFVNKLNENIGSLTECKSQEPLYILKTKEGKHYMFASVTYQREDRETFEFISSKNHGGPLFLRKCLNDENLANAQGSSMSPDSKQKRIRQETTSAKKR